MLSYAYDVLKEGDNVNLSDEEFDNIYNLFAKILINGLNLLIKRGFNKEYVCVSDELPVLRGKVSINDTLKRQSFIHGKISCEYDELSSNVLFNQIIKTTIITLINYKKLDKQIKNQLIYVNRYFQEIDVIRLQKSHFSRIAYHRNNRFYKLIVDICELIFDEVIVTSQKGETIFKDFIRDNRMAALYEKFILNFYKKELTSVLVYSPIFQWQKDDDFEHVGESFLPVMRTDIVLQNKERQLIIDAKYYCHTTQTQFEKHSIHSGNLYQIFTYVKNEHYAFKDESHEVSGMLLYAKTDEEIQPDNSFKMHGSKIQVKTLDLNKPFAEIAKQLNEIANAYFGEEAV